MELQRQLKSKLFLQVLKEQKHKEPRGHHGGGHRVVESCILMQQNAYQRHLQLTNYHTIYIQHPFQLYPFVLQKVINTSVFIAQKYYTFVLYLDSLQLVGHSFRKRQLLPFLPEQHPTVMLSDIQSYGQQETKTQKEKSAQEKTCKWLWLSMQMFRMNSPCHEQTDPSPSLIGICLAHSIFNGMVTQKSAGADTLHRG